MTYFKEINSNKNFININLSHLIANDLTNNAEEAIIIDTIFLNDSQITKSNIKDKINNIFNVDMDDYKLNEIIDELIKNGKIYCMKNILSLSPETLNDVNEINQKNTKIETVALDSWLDKYCLEYNENTDTFVKEQIKTCILKFIRILFLSHGSDCYNLITGIKQEQSFELNVIARKTINLFKFEKSIAANISNFLPHIFNNNYTSEQRSFLLLQLNKAVHYLSIFVERETQERILKAFEHMTIYIDTPILYRFLNLQGEKRFKIINNLVSICKKANIPLKVLNVTVKELERRISYDAKMIIEHPISVDFSKIGYDCRSEDNYLSAYWMERSKTGISPQDFNARFYSIRLILEHFGIEIDDKRYIENPQIQESKINLFKKVRTFCFRDDEEKGKKSDTAIEHDAECLAIIEHLQVPNASTALESRVLFLSSDWSLIRLQKYDYEYKQKVDLVVLPSQLLQIFNITTTVSDYLETFLGLFSSSATSFGANRLSNSSVQEIMSRLSCIKGSTPTLVEKVLVNQLIQQKFETAESEEDKFALIEDAAFLSIKETEEELDKINILSIKQQNELNIKEEEEKRKQEEIINLNLKINTLNEDIEETKTLNNRYLNSIKKNAHNKAKIKALVRLLFGYMGISIGYFAIIIIICSFIPYLCNISNNILIYIKKYSLTWQNESNNSMLSVLGLFCFAFIAGGIKLVKPGYKKLHEKYYDAEIKKL